MKRLPRTRRIYKEGDYEKRLLGGNTLSAAGSGFLYVVSPPLRASVSKPHNARQLLADESNWCQRQAVHPSGRGKSVLGAVGYRFYAVDHPDTMAAVQLLARVIGRGESIYDSVFVQGFNDQHTHGEVLELLGVP
jgi:hypothetical protein